MFINIYVYIFMYICRYIYTHVPMKSWLILGCQRSVMSDPDVLKSRFRTSSRVVLLTTEQ